MKILLWNVRGLGREGRRLNVRDTVGRNKVQVALIQESKLKVMSDNIGRELWGSRSVKWMAVALSRGIILLWDARKIQLIDSWGGCFSLAAIIKDLDREHQWMMCNVYGPV